MGGEARLFDWVGNSLADMISSHFAELLVPNAQLLLPYLGAQRKRTRSSKVHLARVVQAAGQLGARRRRHGGHPKWPWEFALAIT